MLVSHEVGYIFTRAELYELVWAEPIRRLAAKFNASNVGITRECKRAGIPLPPPGHWSKRKAGKKVSRPKLPLRGFGAPNELRISDNHWVYYDLSHEEALAMTIPPPPVFEEEIAAIIERVKKTVSGVKIPKSLTHLHPLIRRLLDDDERRRAKQQEWPYWDKPAFDSPFERRRLKILNGIFTALEQCGMKPSFPGKKARDLSVRVGEQHVHFILDSVRADGQMERERMGYAFAPRGANDKICLCISSSGRFSRDCKSWSDDNTGKIESRLCEIVETLIFTGEISYRDSAKRQHDYLVKSKATAEESERNRKLEEERKRHEHEEKLERQRVKYLLNQAHALRQATEIRTYVKAVRRKNKFSSNPVPKEELEQWASWALAQADQIDPIQSRKIKPLT